jgi:hypothetical protein
MSRSTSCARPGCGASAAAMLSYDYSSGTVWIDDPGDVPGDVWVLCERHADRLTVPRGWNRHDRRHLGDHPTASAARPAC